MRIDFQKLQSNVKGLLYLPSIGNDDADGLPEFMSSKSVPTEFSPNDQNKLLEYFMAIKDKCKCIVEIGVCRNPYGNTSTSILIDNKLDSTIYIGVDLEDKSFLNNPSKNVYTIKGSSFDRQAVYDLMEKLGVKEIDFLFIDGWHSINAVINDWMYTEKLSPYGIIGFHDTSVHPGPALVLDAVDPSMYLKRKFFEDLTNDWGISFAIKIK